MTRVFWPACAVTVGVWEAAALLTRGRLPLVTTASRAAHRRWRRRTRLVVGVWLVALGDHLLRD